MDWLRRTILILIFAGMSIIGCSDDDGPAGPTTGSVAGKVTFKGSWPAMGDIQVSIYSNLTPPYIPMGPPDAATDPIASGSVEYDYSITGLDKGTYTAIFVGWRDPSNPSASRLIGMYWLHADSVGIDATSGLPVTAPTSVTIGRSSLNHTGLNIKADLDLAP